MEHSQPHLQAFLSYSRADQRFARHLQRDLEIRARRLGKRLPRPLTVLRDETDFTAARGLHQEVHDKIAKAEKLIVVCSPAARRESWWVDEEIRIYRFTHNTA